jgi:hypothetical protein
MNVKKYKVDFDSYENKIKNTKCSVQMEELEVNISSSLPHFCTEQ